MVHKRYLTKSRFKLALECPTKLFYTGKKEYANQSLDDSFLAALADGGYQVGELAKCYFPGGHDIISLDYDGALAQTSDLLKNENVTIYEAAIRFENLFIRADVLVKNGNYFKLYEVKAKSINTGKFESFFNAKGEIESGWKPYLCDVAFQKYVIKQAFPDCIVSAHLMLADKKALCPTDGLNQKFLLTTDDNGRKTVVISNELTQDDLDPPILCKINVDAECDHIYSIKDEWGDYRHMVQYFSDCYATDTKIETPISTGCAGCEFDTTLEDVNISLKSGKKECWKKQLHWDDKDFEDQTIFDVWNFRGKKKLLGDGCIKMSQITEDDINPVPDDKAGISPKERQWMQIEKYQNKDNSIWIDKGGLQSEIDSWTFPLHFIDFETTMVAIPFNAGRHPYEGIAFQFSHHTVDEDGIVKHVGEYLNTQQGIFPNYDFIRNLKSQLENDNGTIFRYSNHENTYLNMIYRQLKADGEKVEDGEELCEFIKTITKSCSDSAEKWLGERNMVDMWDLVKRYYYDPATKGSNSIKQVLPAILNSSKWLQNRYSKPIYGASDGIKSHNFTDWQWIQFNNGKVLDPYKLLPKMFQDISEKEMIILSGDNVLKDGGAALTAYARMQFEEMSDYERSEIQKALLKYCELDTMAMVMIYEGWMDLLSQ